MLIVNSGSWIAIWLVELVGCFCVWNFKLVGWLVGLGFLLGRLGCLLCSLWPFVCAACVCSSSFVCFGVFSSVLFLFLCACMS